MWAGLADHMISGNLQDQNMRLTEGTFLINKWTFMSFLYFGLPTVPIKTPSLMNGLGVTVYTAAQGRF